MTLQQLEYIIALDNHRHFVTAADHCFVTQPTLTMQVKKLEDEIGILIFDRTKKPLRPTVAGEQILLKARQILREVNGLKDLVSHEKETLEGEFKLGIIPTLAPYIISIFLPEFIRENPKTTLKIYEMQTSEIIRELKKDTIHIGLLSTPIEEYSIREIPIFSEPFLLYLPKEHEYNSHHDVDADIITTENLLLLNEGHCFRDQTLNICKQARNKASLGFDYESGSIEALKRMVQMNLGYTLVPELSVQSEPDNVCVKKFSSPQPVREISLVVHNSFSKELLIDRLRTAVINNLPEHFVKNENFIRVKWR